MHIFHPSPLDLRKTSRPPSAATAYLVIPHYAPVHSWHANMNMVMSDAGAPIQLRLQPAPRFDVGQGRVPLTPVGSRGLASGA